MSRNTPGLVPSKLSKSVRSHSNLGIFRADGLLGKAPHPEIQLAQFEIKPNRDGQNRIQNDLMAPNKLVIEKAKTNLPTFRGGNNSMICLKKTSVPPY